MGQITSWEPETTRSLGWKDDCGVNTCRRWSPKAAAFSVSLFAQLPSDFRIGGIDTWGILKLLVAFHREVSSDRNKYEVKMNFSISMLSFPVPPCYCLHINHIPDEELLFQLAIWKNNKYSIYNLTFVPENCREHQKGNKIPRILKTIDLSMTYCNRTIFLLFQLRPAMSHVCRATQCIRRFILIPLFYQLLT